MLVFAQQLGIEIDAVDDAHLFEESGFTRLASAQEQQLNLNISREQSVSYIYFFGTNQLFRVKNKN